MKKAKYNLLLVAHPDDESLFFSSVVLRQQKRAWKLICATDGNADGRGVERAKELLAAARALGIRDVEHWRYADIYEKRLPIAEITARLCALPEPSEIYTHGPLGEYGHPHHQDIAMAAYGAFAAKKILVPAYNVVPDLSLVLKAAELKRKQKIYGEIYRKETLRFAHILPCTSAEGFASFSREEVELLYGFLCGGELPDKKRLKKFRWLHGHLLFLREQTNRRGF